MRILLAVLAVLSLSFAPAPLPKHLRAPDRPFSVGVWANHGAAFTFHANGRRDYVQRLPVRGEWREFRYEGTWRPHKLGDRPAVRFTYGPVGERADREDFMALYPEGMWWSGMRLEKAR